MYWYGLTPKVLIPLWRSLRFVPFLAFPSFHHLRLWTLPSNAQKKEQLHVKTEGCIDICKREVKREKLETRNMKYETCGENHHNFASDSDLRSVQWDFHLSPWNVITFTELNEVEHHVLSPIVWVARSTLSQRKHSREELTFSPISHWLRNILAGVDVYFYIHVSKYCMLL